MPDPLMQQIDRYNNWHEYEITVTYTAYVEAHSEYEAEGIARDMLDTITSDHTPHIEANKIPHT
ncbi:hypothetical protein COJE103337_03950 [Corynebacterium jeikeium]|uniref:hypothetical protein n=1 Tax=Corynebacterium jeikeium TaxID=38289 RepID=UPI0001B7150F|nr:hypothetical protein [Corynebacterium jeikeium]EEW17403.1 hypothetical protein HMPREF0297_0280 [Corynebacterium jeikeium ATCC 43734]OOD30738.1 hypothetical protein BWP03_06680 [Corynebacterium jeikeium]WCZ54148.1 hypothetical protein CJEIK_08265 [Corynebacterium jeikeium]SUY80546.1 Uncharacterised protein [Corynebacterium jeikeium]